MSIKCNENGKTYSPDQWDQLIDDLNKFDATQTIKLIWNEPQNTQAIASFFQQLSQLNPPLACAIQWFLHVEEKHTPFYLFNRKQFITENQLRIKQALTPENMSQKQEKKIRKAKLDLGNRESYFQDVPLQQQQQQQQQEQIKRTRSKRKFVPKLKRESKKAIEVSIEDLQDVITRDDILSNPRIQKELERFYTETFPDRLSAHRPTLVEIWDNVVGQGAADIQDKSKTLTGIKKDVFQEIIRHYRQFLYGINIDNLPAVVNELGEVVKRVELCCHLESEQYVLRFAADAAADKIDKFTILLAPSYIRPAIEDFNALVEPDKQTQMQVAVEQLNQIATQSDTHEIRQKAQIAFQVLLQVIQPPAEEKILEVLQQFELTLRSKENEIPLKAQHYQYLADILVHGDAAGVLCFLTFCNQLQDKRLFYAFLDDAVNFQQWATKDGLTHLEMLAKFNDVERIWWAAFVQQHQAAGAPLNFNVLFDAFELFRLQLRVDKDNVLPSSFPFQGIRHMQLALERLLYVIQHGPEKEQIKHLRGLDLGPLGAYYASRFEEFSFVLAGAEVNMGITRPYALLKLAEHADAQKIFSYAMHDDKLFQTCMNLRERHVKFVSENQPRHVEYADTKRFYYRYLAKPIEDDGAVIDIDAYHQMARRIEDLSENLTRVNRGPIFVFKPESETISIESLSESHISGYVCVKSKIGEVVALYFIDRYDSSTPRKLSLDGEALAKFKRFLLDLERDLQSNNELTLKQRQDLEDTTRFTPEENGHHRDLEDAAKASLLYICAVAGLGRRACNQAISPSAELSDFLKTLQELAKKTDVKAAIFIETIHLHGLSAKTCPTLGELTTLIKLISLSMVEGERDKEASIKNAVKLTLEIVHCYGDAAFEIFKNYRDRFEQQRLHAQRPREEPSLAGTETAVDSIWLTPDYQIFIAGLNTVFTEAKHNNSSKLPMLMRISPILALIKDPIDENYLSRVLNLIDRLQILHPKLQDIIIEQLMDTNLSISKELPTFEQFGQLCQAMLDEFEGRDIYILRPPERDCSEENCYVWNTQRSQLSYKVLKEGKPTFVLVKIKDEAKLKNIIQQGVARFPQEKSIHFKQDEFKAVQSCFDSNQPNYAANYLDMDKPTLKGKVIPMIAHHTPCRVGRGPMAESKINLVDVFRRFTATLKLQNIRETVGPYLKLPIVGSYLKQHGEPTLFLIDQFVNKINADDAAETEQNLLDILDQIDENCIELHKGCSKYLGAIKNLQSLVVRFFPEKEAQIKQFFERPSLAVFAAPVFEELYTVPMRQQLQALQLGAEAKTKAFEDFLLKQIQPESADNVLQRSSQVAAAYGERFNRLTQFFNSLIRLRNNNPSDFQVCLDKLLHQNLYEKLDFKDCSRLFIVLNQISKISIVDQLTWLFVELNKTEAQGSAKRLGQVLNGLEALIEYQEMLEEDDLTKYFKESLRHNFRNDTPFSFGGEIKIQKICNEFRLNSQDATSLRQALSAVYTMILNEDNLENKSLAEVFLETTVAQFKDKLPDILPFLLVLLRSVKSKQDIEGYQALLQQLPTNLTELNQWRVIFSAKDTMKDLSFHEIVQIVDGIQRHREQLTSMCDVLFDGEPHPTKSSWIEALTSDDPLCLSKFKDEFDRHPYGAANWKKNKHHFEAENVIAVIGGIRRLLDNQLLSEAEQLDLKLQFDYVNALGTTYKLRPLDHHGQPIKLYDSDGQACTEFQLNQCSRKMLKMLAERLIDEFRVLEQAHPSPDCLSDRGHRRLTLQLLAVMRELYYRSTARIPNSTQMLTLIYALDHPERQLFGINTGEGKSITTALFAALLAAKGGTVCVPTANRTLVNQDYYGKRNDRFFRQLGLKSSRIDNNSAKDDFHVKGIHYGTDADLSNYCSNAELKGWNLSVGSDGQVYPLFMVKDEYDYSMDDRTQFKRAIPYEEDQAAESPYTWIYHAANEFVRRPDFLASEEAWDEEEDVQQFRLYLDSIADAPRTGSDEKKRQVMFWGPRLSALINDAAAAQKYVEGRDFFISHLDEEGRELGYTIAVPFNESGVPQWGGTFPGSRQACLHARLQDENPGIDYPFPIDSEQFCIASRSSMGFMRLFKIIIGLTGTPGSHNELLEQQDKFGMYATGIPPHKEGVRDELAPLFVSGHDLAQAILDAILYHAWYKYPLPIFVIRYLDRMLSLYQTGLQIIRGALGYAPLPEKQSQPILIVTKNKIKAEALHARLLEKFGKDRIQLISGVEPNEEREALLKIAGREGEITISTPLSGRGTDIDPEHEDGLYTIKIDFICTSRDERQIMGRSSRKGQKGKYLAIYDVAGFHLSGWLSTIFGLSDAERKKQIAHRQEQLNQEVAVQRYYLQEVDEIQQVIFNQYDAWMCSLFGENGQNRISLIEHDSATLSLENRLLRQRGALIQALSDCWQAHLQDSAPDLPNPYVHRNIDQTLNTFHLDNALQRFEEDALQIWTAFQKGLEEEQKIMTSSLSVKDNVRLDFLKQDDVSEALKYRKLNLHRDRTQKNMAAQGNKRRIERRLFLESNTAWAIAHYDDRLLNHEQRQKLGCEHAKIYLDYVYGQSQKLQGLDNRSEDIATRFRPLLKILQQEKNFQARASLQTVAFECIRFYDGIAEYFPEKLKTLEFSSAIDNVRNHYLTNFSIQLAENLLFHFDWAADPTSFYCRNIEYKRVMQATQEIRTAAQDLKEVSSGQSKIEQIKALQRLHRALVKHEKRLNHSWYYFSFGVYFFGYSDTRGVITQALAQIEALEPVGYSSEMQYVGYETGQCQAYLEDFWVALERQKFSQDEEQYWSFIKEQLQDIYQRYDGAAGFFVIDELLHCLSHHVDSSGPNLSKAIQSLITRLASIKQTMHRDHPHEDSLCGELFLSQKEASLYRCLKQILYSDLQKNLIYDSMKLEVKAGHTGFKPYYEVNVKSDYYHSISLEKFARDSRREKIERQLEQITKQIEALESDISVNHQRQLEIQRNTRVVELPNLPEISTSGKTVWEKFRRKVFKSQGDQQAFVNGVSTESPKQKNKLPRFMDGFSFGLSKSHPPQVDVFSPALEGVNHQLQSSENTPSSSFARMMSIFPSTEKKSKRAITSSIDVHDSQVRPSGAQQSSIESPLEVKIRDLNKEKETLAAKKMVLNERLKQCSPNIMSRRFNTLGEFLDFESELCAKAEGALLGRKSDTEIASVLTDSTQPEQAHMFKP